MVGLLLLTHAPLGSAFIDAASHVFRSRPERLEAVDVLADQNVDEVRRIVREAIVRLDDGSGVLIMTDIIGGTPSNCCPQTGDANQVAVIAGISLPMLLRAITYRQDQLDVVVEMALAGGQNGATRIENRIRIGQS
ncbi:MULTISPECIES: PTS sugar transporter subunit IIA [Undibacterium]|jgi:PTS system ascorbate-specific IIA component|uniref:PTS fructose transporter subunit IIA n=2 Tax=Undibacterium TaxID=401469 RepID=A0A941DHS3_9BURK|nr:MULTISPECIES: PTS fructose transporter subunit IIA [Undibacterium]MBR7748171.1 PTS fructose transporter subunit IIA [Undibacterium baiyunense]GGX25289.1 PTS mannose transporter subunit IIA [Undibacterium macrobrachii]